ncbi:MAG: ABC transporter ATP-binding protein [Candidatus Rokubacteria bacterium]|nr:ABC transporter ATP-binding protein [Candidatus Rokubacteria bacterium]
MLELRDVGKVFGGLQALQDVSLRVDAGRIHGLIGPNGAGKTTLFNVVTGVTRASKGSVTFDGHVTTGLPPHAIAWLGIARTYQLVRPFFELTTTENVEVGIAFGRGTRSGRRSDARAEARRFLELVDLADKHDHRAEELNLGERKRLEIAKALAAQPRLLLFDEVLAGLNPTETARAVELFRRINGMGITILMIEHNMRAIMTACEHIFVLHHGKLIAAGSPDAVSRDHAVVEAYLGRKDPALRRRKALADA